jgi:hypothetical protein
MRFITLCLANKFFNSPVTHQALGNRPSSRYVVTPTVYREGSCFNFQFKICRPDLLDPNELAEYGYNRDGQKGQKQIVVGLMTDKQGWPITAEVFAGNTQEPKLGKKQLRAFRPEAAAR